MDHYSLEFSTFLVWIILIKPVKALGHPAKVNIFSFECADTGQFLIDRFLVFSSHLIPKESTHHWEELELNPGPLALQPTTPTTVNKGGQLLLQVLL